MGGNAFGATFDTFWEHPPAVQECAEKLREWGILGDLQTPEEIYKRYIRFEGVEFGVAPEQEWPRLRQ